VTWEWFVNVLTVILAVVLLSLGLVGLLLLLIKMMLIDGVNFLGEHAEDFE
jgi:hypothetical protein